MAIALRSVGSRGTTSIGVPSGVDIFDAIVIAVDCNILTVSSAPACSGFTLAGIGSSSGTTGRSIAYLVKRATGPESGSYALTNPSGGSISAAEAFAWTGVQLTGTFWTTPTIIGATTGSTATPAVSITDSAGDQRLWTFATSGGSVTIPSVPSGWAEISPTSSSIMHTVSQSSAGGASGSLSLTMSATSNPRVAGVISLIADTTGGPPAAPASQNPGFFGVL